MQQPAAETGQDGNELGIVVGIGAGIVGLVVIAVAIVILTGRKKPGPQLPPAER